MLVELLLDSCLIGDCSFAGFSEVGFPGTSAGAPAVSFTSLCILALCMARPFFENTFLVVHRLHFILYLYRIGAKEWQSVAVAKFFKFLEYFNRFRIS